MLPAEPARWAVRCGSRLRRPQSSRQNNDAKPADKAPAAGQEPAKETQKVDEFAEAQTAFSGPAGNPECVWLGRRVVSLLWRDDLDTAFRHLDLYDRFGCPSAHIQATFRCLILHGNTSIRRRPTRLTAASMPAGSIRQILPFAAAAARRRLPTARRPPATEFGPGAHLKCRKHS